MSLRPGQPSHLQTATSLEALANQLSEGANLSWLAGGLDEVAYGQELARVQHLYAEAASERAREVAFWQRYCHAAAQVLALALKPGGLDAEGRRYATALHAAITARCPAQAGLLDFLEILEDFTQDITPQGGADPAKMLESF